MAEEQCGWPTAEDHGCKHPPTEGERCWLHAEDAKKAGRPTKFDDERARWAVEAARSAKSIRGCARAALVDHATLGNWLRSNPTYTDENGEEREFFTAFMRARAQGETVLVRGGLTRDEVDSSHARFLLSTSFDYTEEKRIQIDDVSSDPDDATDMEELLTQAEDLF